MSSEIEEYVRSLGLDAYTVGGAVRDELAGRDSKDADFLVPGLDIAGLRDALAPHGRTEELVVAGRPVGVRFFPYRLVTATLPSHKTLHYLPAVLGKILAARARTWESLYLSADDTVLEGTTSNVFIVRRGTVVTPPLRGILPGVTRRFLESVARRGGSIEVVGSGPVLPLVAAALVDRGIVPDDLRAEQPTLEDAFLNLVGPQE